MKEVSPSMELTVDFLAGTELIDAVFEAKIKAAEWGLAYIKFNFNGVNVSVSGKTPMITEEFLLGKYHAALKGKIKHIIV